MIRQNTQKRRDHFGIFEIENINAGCYNKNRMFELHLKNGRRIVKMKRTPGIGPTIAALVFR